jgi:hypothetical protein
MVFEGCVGPLGGIPQPSDTRWGFETISIINDSLAQKVSSPASDYLT